MTPSSSERGEHTPGPWSVEVEAEPGEDCPASIYVCHPNTECDVTVVATMGRAWSVAEQRKMADAHLIAAAPELLEALQECEALLRGLCPRIPHDGPSTAEQQAEYERIGFPLSRAQRATAKATGFTNLPKDQGGLGVSGDTQTGAAADQLPIRERLSGPHEWGYRCLVGGGFIADGAPFEAGGLISDLLGALEEAIELLDDCEISHPLRWGNAAAKARGGAA